MGRKGIMSFSSSSSIQSPKFENDDKKINEFFHIRAIMKHTKVYTLFNNGSQVNFIFESIVNKLGLKTRPHNNPYPLGWVQKDT